jgi:phosphohistidine phosphatase
MKLYLMRHAEAESGEQLDPTRKLTDLGKTQAKMMGKWLARQTERPEIVIESNMKRSRQTAKRVAKQLDVDRVPALAGALDPDSTPERAIDEMIRVGQEGGYAAVIAVSHGPLVEEALAQICGGEASQFHFAHGSVAHWDEKMRLHWLVTPNTVARDEDAIVEAALGVVVEALNIAEAPGKYTYDEVEEKRLVLGDGGQSGNCEHCEEAADLGWVGMDDIFAGPMGDEDSPPLHPNCDCSVEYRTRRVRVPA